MGAITRLMGRKAVGTRRVEAKLCVSTIAMGARAYVRGTTQWTGSEGAATKAVAVASIA